MVEHLSDLNCLELIKIKIQEENLSGKEDFEIWAATFGVKTHRYHADNGRFSEQHFRSAIKDSNQTIKFYGVGSHHQNDIVERNIQTLTLGDRKLLLHEKRYWPEAITTMLWPYEMKPLA